MSRTSDKFLELDYTIASPGDIRSEQSFAAANNVSTATAITGFSFPNASVRAFSAILSVSIDATSELYELFKIEGIQTGSDWVINYTSIGDNSGVSLSINTSGQIRYTSTSSAGFVSNTMKFRAITMSK